MSPTTTHSVNTYSLLALCARAEGHPTQYHHLRQQAARLTDWSTLPGLAERHGLAPLLYTHLQAAGVAGPAEVRQQLQARTIQHRHANRMRAAALAEILAAFQTAGIEALLLKGAALAHLVYPEPGLRPMRDVDVLVSRAQARQAQGLLAELGFAAPLPGQTLPAKHLLTAQRWDEGLPVSVELHHNLYTEGTAATGIEALRPRAVPVSLGGVTAWTLGYEAMLDHVYQHSRIIFDPLRLISLADLVSLAERFAAEIDWPRVSPRARNALALCHWLTPLSEALRRAAAALPLDRPPRGSGLDFTGWPRYPLAAQRDKSYMTLLRDTFYPSEWWLRFYYAPASPLAYYWGRAVTHPRHIFGWVAHYYRHRE